IVQNSLGMASKYSTGNQVREFLTLRDEGSGPFAGPLFWLMLPLQPVSKEVSKQVLNFAAIADRHVGQVLPQVSEIELLISSLPDEFHHPVQPRCLVFLVEFSKCLTLSGGHALDLQHWRYW